MIEVRGVSKVYGHPPVHAVRGLSFVIEPGQCVGLLGPNGAGKSTTIRMIAGYIPPSAGTVSVCGHDTLDASLEARRCLGYLPESTPLHSEMSVEGMLMYRAGLYGLGRRAANPLIENALEICRVRDVRRRRIGELSKGYKQRVGLASALVHNPKVLVLDEPTSGLDPTQIRETRSLIKDLADQRTVLVSSHILPEIEQTCDRVLIMARGRLRADGSPGALTSGWPTAIVECKAGTDPQRIELALSRVPGVDKVDPLGNDGDWTRFRLHAQGNDVREGVGNALAGLNVPVRELRREQLTLEQVFVRVVEGEQEDQA